MTLIKPKILLLARKIFYLMVFISLLWNSTSTNAQEVAADSLARYYELSLEELQSLKMRTNSSELEKVINTLLSVASQKALSSRESPSIVSLITAEDIKKSGARDLIDVLRTIPGFDFAYDGESEIGVGIRGNWANEGKVLLLIDGQMMNKIFSGDLSFGNHYPLANVNRIEIIRGPGSAIYGGFAEYGVINIITNGGAEIDGVQLTTNYGLQKDSFARRTIDLAIGKKSQTAEFSLTGFIGDGNRSSGNSFVSINRGFSRYSNGSISSLAGNSDASPTFLNLRLARNNLHFNATYDGYESRLLNFGDSKGDRFVSRKNRNMTISMSNEIRVSRKLNVTPQLSYVYQAPRISGVPDSLTLTQDYGTRLGANVNASYNLNRKFNLSGGVQFFYDRATNSNDSIQTLQGFVESIDYTNWAGYLQMTAKASFANIIIGGRYDHNSSYGDAFVPRFAITRRVDKFHVKALYSSSFRAPTIENIARGISNTSSFVPGIKPETTTVIELEGGYQLNRNSLFQVNVFQSRVKDPIVSLGSLSLYTNYDKAASKGVEGEFQYKSKNVMFSANYSFYSVKNERTVDIYSARNFNVADTLLPTGNLSTESVLLAFPAHKLTGKLNFNVLPHVNFNATAVYNSQKYAYELNSTEIAGNYRLDLVRSKETLTADFFLQFDQVISGLNVGVGVYNAFDTNFKFSTPYYTGSGSLEGLSREWLVKLSYKF